MRCWCGYLSGVRCKWFAYGLADAAATPSSLASLKSILSRLSSQRGHQTDVCCLVLFFRKRCHWYICFLELDYRYCFSFQINWVLALERWPKGAAFLLQDQERMRPRGWFLIWVLCHCWLCDRKGIRPVIDLLELPRTAGIPTYPFFFTFASQLIFFFVNRRTPFPGRIS